MTKSVEILLYTLKEGAGAEFFSIMETISVPLHKESGIDIVWHGQSQHDPDSYFLIRAFPDMQGLQEQQQAFYRSDAWRSGPRRAIIDRIEVSLKVVVPMSEEAIEAIRTSRLQPETLIGQ